MSAIKTVAPPVAAAHADAAKASGDEAFIPAIHVIERDPPKVRPEGAVDTKLWWERLRRFFAVESDDSAAEVLRQLVGATPMGRRVDSAGVNLALETIAELAPEGRVDTLMALQMMAMHGLSMDFYREAAAPGHVISTNFSNGCRRTDMPLVPAAVAGLKLSRGFALHLQTYDGRRGRRRSGGNRG